jgi:predicted Zn-dependent protease
MTRIVPLALTLAVAGALSACGVNPVTGKKEIQFVSEAQELQIGQQHYAPTRQSEGGDFVVLPELTAYVAEVGQKLAAVADRKLPYEFSVLNSSVPNAWALPGGKIAINRGLLTELKNEAELAAVLGHEIVHAAARHGAKAQERGTLLQAGLAAATIGAAVGGVDQNLAQLTLQGAGVGAQIIQQTYGREQELESDEYGIKYMKAVGYDPMGAVTLQETFVRLSGARQQSWVEGLFASHPPSQERVNANRAHAARLGPGGELGEARYRERVGPLLELKPAYDKYDEATKAARAGKVADAKRLTNEAVKLVPREGRFHQFLGELALNEKRPKDAVAHYQKAIDLNPNYFGSYLGAGVAQLQTGNRAQAEAWLTRSAQLLPTAPAAYYLGNIARDKGDAESAVKYYQAAAGSKSSYGQQAAGELAKLDVPRNPGNYLATAPQVDARGRLVVLIENRAPVPIGPVQLTPVLVDGGGRIVQQGNAVTVNQVIAPGQRVAADAGIGSIAQQQLPYVRFRIDGAKVAQ